MNRARRPVRLLSLALLLAACSETPIEEEPQTCATPPCTPAEVPQKTLDRQQALVGELLDRYRGGESLTEIAAWLNTLEDVREADARDDALRFRLESGYPKWAYFPSNAPMVSTATMAAVLGAPPGQGLVLREGGSTQVKKRALIVESFAFQFGSVATSWEGELEKFHDYDAGSVSYRVNHLTSDDDFGNWNNHRLVWMISHGTFLEGSSGPYSLLFSGKPCGLTKWLIEARAANRADEPTNSANLTLGQLLGVDYTKAYTQLTEVQKQQADASITAEHAEFMGTGKACQDLQFESGQGSALMQFVGYDEAWWPTQPELDHTLLVLSLCESIALPVRKAAGAPYGILGWSDVVQFEHDRDAMRTLMDEMISKGRTLDKGVTAIREAGLDSRTWTSNTGVGRNPSLLVTSGKGQGKIRLRETVTLRDPRTLEPLTDFSTISAASVSAAGNTSVDVNVLIDGLGADYPAKDFEVRIENQSGGVIWGPFPVEEPQGDDAHIDYPARLELPFEVGVNPISQELVAIVKLAEDEGLEETRHDVIVDITAAKEPLWSFTVAGVGIAEGDFISAPFVRPPAGTPGWALTFSQFTDAQVHPLANLILPGHTGRQEDCTGQTGLFQASLGIAFGPEPTQQVGGGDDAGDPECPSSVEVNIETFSKEEGLTASLSGTLCKGERVGNETVVVPVAFSGSFTWPEAGCGGTPPDPNEGFVGSYRVAEATHTCIDLYQNAQVAPAYMQLCMQPEFMCSPMECETAGQIGECDFRDDAALISFRGTIQHYSAYPDGPSAADLAAGCALQGGTWQAGP